MSYGDPRRGDFKLRRSPRAGRIASPVGAWALRPCKERGRGEGRRTVRALTDQLNARGVPTLRGGRWHVASTQNLLKRLEALGVRV